MDFNDVLIVLSVSDSSGILGILDRGRIAVGKDLCFQEEQDIINQLTTAHYSGYNCCIVTREGTYINSSVPLIGLSNAVA